MRRKIPGKKHRGVKDPDRQRAIRNEKLKDVVNAPPSDPNTQELPKSVLEMNRLRELVKNGKVKKKKKKGKLIDSKYLSSAGPKLPGMKQRDMEFPRLKQRPGESDNAFFRRLDVATNEALNEARLEAKHDVVMKRDSDGVVTETRPNPPSPSNIIQKSRKPKTAPLIEGSSRDKLNLLKERKLKKKLKKLNHIEGENEKKIDFVKFGEVVHQPPLLNRRPRGCKKSDSDRPGKKPLLLTSLLNPTNDGVSMSRQKHLASAREEAIKAYREMKARNKTNLNRTS